MEDLEAPAFEARANTLGRARRPFVFVANYRADHFRLADVGDPPWTWEAGPRWAVAGPDLAARHPKPAEAVINPITIVEPPDRESFTRACQAVQAAQSRGESWLANLCARTRINLHLYQDRSETPDLRTLYQQAASPFALWFRDGQNAELLSITPEPFVTIGATTIRTNPMKGTRPGQSANPTDPARAELLADPKEEAEHTTVVDLLRNDLGQVASAVRVKRFRYLEYLTTGPRGLWSTSSEIEGDLEPNWPDRLGSIMRLLLPAGSVTGAPKRRTMEILGQVEPVDRGYYTGVVGFFDGQSFWSRVLIRIVVGQNLSKQPEFWYHSGSGITVYSNPDQEYDELLAKVYLPLRGPDAV